MKYQYLEDLLKSHGITVYRLSKETGIAPSTFSDWKSGRSLPKTEKLKKIAEYFGVGVSYFLGDDISPLKECESLRFLNVSFSKVADLSPLDDLKLERFVCLSTNVPEADRPAFEEKHPDCWTRFTGENPYSLGWRYDDVGVTRSEYYIHIREVFDYDAVDRELARQEAAKKAAEQND
jgi:transcriptional regulator with XRE-family HTH domain